MDVSNYKTEVIEIAVALAEAGGLEPTYTKSWIELYKPWENLQKVKPAPNDGAKFLLKLMLKKGK